VFRKRVPDVGSGDRKSSAADGGQSDWRHDQTVSSVRTQSSSTRDINSRGERSQIPWCVAVEDSVCQHGDFEYIRSGTRSQYKLTRASVMWSERLRWKISRAAAFNADCSLRIK